MRRRTNRAAAGFTALEAVVTLALFSLILGGFVLSTDRIGALTKIGNIEQEVARDSMRLMTVISEDLSRSGFTSVGGVDYPVFFDNGVAGDDFPEFAHAPPHRDDPAIGLSREIIFPLPADVNGDGWPDLSGEWAPVWQTPIFAYMLVPNADGTNNFVRQSSDGRVRVLSRDVIRVVFEDPAATGFTIPLDSIRVRVDLSREGSDGTRYSYSSEQVVSLTNGWLAR